jgi:hypothetical protein
MHSVVRLSVAFDIDLVIVIKPSIAFYILTLSDVMLIFAKQSVFILSVIRLNFVMLSIIMLSVIMTSFVKLRIIMLNVAFLHGLAKCYSVQDHFFLLSFQLMLC